MMNLLSMALSYVGVAAGISESSEIGKIAGTGVAAALRLGVIVSVGIGVAVGITEEAVVGAASVTEDTSRLAPE